MSPPSGLTPVQRLADRLLSTASLTFLWVAGVAIRWMLTLCYANVKDPSLWEFGYIARNHYTTGVYAFNEPGVPSAYMPPAYPILISLMYRIFGIGPSAHLALALILLLFEAAMPFLVAWVASTIWGRTAARVAFLLATFWPMYLSMSLRLSNVPIYSGLLVLAAGILLSRHVSIQRKGGLCGLALGLYALNRFEAIVMLAPFLVCLLQSSLAQERSIRPGMRAAVAMLLVFGILVSPWLIRNWLAFGRFTFGSTGGFALIRGHHDGATGGGRDPWPAGRLEPDDGTAVPSNALIESLTYKHPMDEFIKDDWYKEEALRYFRSHPRREFELAARKIYYFLTVDWTHPISRVYAAWVPSLVALGVGILDWVRRGRRDPRQNFLWLLFGTQMGIAVIFFVLPRYRMVVDFVPLLFLAGWIASFLTPRPAEAATAT